VLGCYVSESEGANFWLQVLSDMALLKLVYLGPKYIEKKLAAPL